MKRLLFGLFFFLFFPMGVSLLAFDLNDGCWQMMRDDGLGNICCHLDANGNRCCNPGYENQRECIQRRAHAPSGYPVDQYDSDCDGVPDSIEDRNYDCVVEPGETNWLSPDTDGDGLDDGVEVLLLHTNPLNRDTDGDGIPDGVEVHFHTLYTPGVDTDPLNPDTDGDGLCDGNVSHGGTNHDVTCVRGEDLNLNGVVDRDPITGCLMETDPRNHDTDSDGRNDRDEICVGGACTIDANIAQAVNCVPQPPRFCVEDDGDRTQSPVGDNPAVGSSTYIRQGNSILLTVSDRCVTHDILREAYCSRAGQILKHYYLCIRKPHDCTNDAQGLGTCPVQNTYRITNPEVYGLPP